MKLITSIVGVLSLALCILPSRAQIIDNFSTNDSGNYHAYNAYQAGAASPATFAINGSGQLQPTGGAGDTTIYLRNTGQELSDSTFGQSASLDLVTMGDTGSQNVADALGFSTTLTPTSGTNVSFSPQSFELGIVRSGGAYHLASSNTSIANGTVALPEINLTLGSVTETVTRVSNTGFSYAFNGAGVVGGPVTGSFSISFAAGNAVYFGPEVFGGNAAGDQIEDNLGYNANAVREPSTYAMILAGLALLGVLSRRKGSLSNN